MLVICKKITILSNPKDKITITGMQNQGQQSICYHPVMQKTPESRKFTKFSSNKNNLKYDPLRSVFGNRQANC